MQDDNLRAIISGDLVGPAAADALRESLVELYARQGDIDAYRARIAEAEIMVIYGTSGRPSRSTTFIEGAG